MIHQPAISKETNPLQHTYNSLLLHPRWHNLRTYILTRDGNCCKNCGSKEKLRIHHRQYHINATTGLWLPPWQYHESLLVTLCAICHENGHAKFKIPVFSIHSTPASPNNVLQHASNPRL